MRSRPPKTVVLVLVRAGVPTWTLVLVVTMGFFLSADREEAAGQRKRLVRLIGVSILSAIGDG